MMDWQNGGPDRAQTLSQAQLRKNLMKADGTASLCILLSCWNRVGKIAGLQHSGHSHALCRAARAC